jgi:formate/nitrite transporter FocA (FNT family)
MTYVRKFLWTVVCGALLGAVVFAWLSPNVIAWYFSPPSDLSISCKPAVEWAIHTYRKVLFTGVLLGAIVSSILFFAFYSRGGKSGAQPVPEGAQNDPLP